MKQQIFLALFLSIIILPAAASAKKPRGKISNLAAFSKVRSYCVDASDLPSDEAYDLKRFISNESGPKKLLPKLPWLLASDCSEGAPGVIVRIEFQQFSPVNPSAQGEPPTIRAYLRVFQGSSSQALYEVESAPANDTMGAMSDAPLTDPLAVQRYDAVYAAFWFLIEDVHRVSQMIPK
jgi:hypothetical protein